MEYNFNIQHLDIQYALINAFMIEASADILDISYNYEGTTLNIQVVLVEGVHLSEQVKEKIGINLPCFTITINEIHLSKEKFNENKGEWPPKYYQWIGYLLFYKGEA